MKTMEFIVKSFKDNKKFLSSIIYNPFLIFLAMEIFYKLCNYKYGKPPSVTGHVLSFLSIMFIYWVITAIVSKTKLSTIIMSVIVFVYCFANQIKISYSDAPLFLSDFLFVDTAETFVDILEGTILSIIGSFIFRLLLFIAMLVGICYYTSKNQVEIRNIKHRIIGFIMPIAVIAILLLPYQGISKPVLKVVFGADTRSSVYATSNMQYYFKYGVMAGMYGQELEGRLVEPEGYDEAMLDDILAEVANEEKETGEWGQPNIIMVFSESFWDIDQLDELKFDRPVAENFNKLKEKGLLFDMITPSFGGLSSNPEFEMLTGGSLRYFSNGFIPYMQLYKNDSYYDAPSVIGELKNNGYTTKIVSTWADSLFACGKIYDYFGVDITEFREDLSNASVKGGRISDEYVTSKIINEFNEKDPDEKMFYMVLTAQAHMPYPINKYSNYDISLLESSLEGSDNDPIISFAQGIYDADQQLLRLYEYIQTIDEPTIIIFYGDHLPFLKTKGGRDAMQDLEFFNTDDDLLNYYRKYNTQCLILGNYELNADDTKYLGPDLVMSYVMNHMDIEISDYYKWLYTTKDVLPASNYFISVDQNGKLYDTGLLEGEMQKNYWIREWMNWKFFVHLN